MPKFERTEMTHKCPVSGKPVELYIATEAPKGMGKECFLAVTGEWKTGLLGSRNAAITWAKDMVRDRENFVEGVTASSLQVEIAGRLMRKFRVSSPKGWTSDRLFNSQAEALSHYGLEAPSLPVVEVIEEDYDPDADVLDGFEDDAGMKDASPDELLDFARQKAKEKANG